MNDNEKVKKNKKCKIYIKYESHDACNRHKSDTIFVECDSWTSYASSCICSDKILVI